MKHYWMGLTDRKTEGTWLWESDQTVADYVAWDKPKNPDNLGPLGEDCAEILADFNDWNCEKPLRRTYPLCQKNC